jgi:hypothetical protein
MNSPTGSNTPKGTGPNINKSGAASYSKGISACADGSSGTSTGVGGISGKPGGIGFPCGSMPETKTNKYVTQMYDI